MFFVFRYIIGNIEKTTPTESSRYKIFGPYAGICNIEKNICETAIARITDFLRVVYLKAHIMTKIITMSFSSSSPTSCMAIESIEMPISGLIALSCRPVIPKAFITIEIKDDNMI